MDSWDTLCKEYAINRGMVYSHTVGNIVICITLSGEQEYISSNDVKRYAVTHGKAAM